MMLSRVADWYAATDISGNDDRLEQRRRAAEVLVGLLEKPSKSNLILEFVSLCLEVAGDKRSAGSNALEAVLDAISDAQPSLNRQASATSLDPRLCGLMALGELLHRRLGKREVPRQNEPALTAAQAIVCALQYQAVSAGSYLDTQLATLLTDARQLIAKVDNGRRTRASKSLNAIAAAEDAASAAQLVKGAVGDLARNAALDREEIHVLWWVISGYSLTQATSFRALSVGDGAVIAGYELARMVSAPLTEGIAVLAARVALLAPEESASPPLESVSNTTWVKCIPQPINWLPTVSACFPVLRAGAMNAGILIEAPSTLINSSKLTREELAIQVARELSLYDDVFGDV